MLLVALLCAAATTALFAKEYRAQRFDARIEVMNGGAIKVTETIVFEFTEGTSRRVFRTIPTRYTDGVEFVSASMNGQVLPRGKNPGEVEVRRKNGLRIDWHFTPVSPSTHTFTLEYIVRGVVKRVDGQDLLEWQVLPREHDYAIASATVEVVAPVAPSALPRISTRRIDGRTDVVEMPDAAVVVRATDIRRNGTFVLSVPFEAGSVLDALPAWQARRELHRERMPIWLAVAGGVLLAGVALLFGLRQNYDAPPPSTGAPWSSMIPPDPMPPALAGALVSNGQPRPEHVMATLVSLAERGIVRIREEEKGAFGQRNFTVERVRSHIPLAPHEEIVLDLVSLDGPGSSVPLAKARALLLRGSNWKMFERAVLGELDQAQLLDANRMASRQRYVHTGVFLVVLASVVSVVCFALLESNGGWPFLVPLAIGLVGFAAFLISRGQTPLTNDGIRRAEQWRAFRDHIKDPQRIEPRWGASGPAEARILPLALALGVASAWARFMKRRSIETPRWFQAASSLENGQSFAAFIASTASATHGGGTYGAGVSAGVAGGGASGAS
jgi:hypothetical protein